MVQERPKHANYFDMDGTREGGAMAASRRAGIDGITQVIKKEI